MRYPKHFTIALLAMFSMLVTISSSASAAYPPLSTADGKPTIAAHAVRLEGNAVELALQVLAPGKSVEAVRIDNIGGISSRWRSDGKDEAAPLSITQDGKSHSFGAQTMNLALGKAETLLTLTLKDNGAFAGKSTEFRVTAFFVGGERAMCVLGAGSLPTVAPVQTAQNNSASTGQTEKQTAENSGYVESILKAAEQGDAEAQYSLGLRLLIGDSVTQDAGRAAYWFRKAAEQGVIIAQYRLGEMYAAGNGVTQNAEQSTYWFRKAASAPAAQKAINAQAPSRQPTAPTQDNAPTQMATQHIAAPTALAEKQAAEALAQAVAPVRKAAEQGDADAQYNLGLMYGMGDGVAEDHKQAVGWFRKAAEQGYPAAQYVLGFIYGTGNGVAQDKNQAVEWFRKAAEQGNTDAQYALGLIYGVGSGVAQDDRQAVEWFRKAAEQGYPAAQHILADISASQKDASAQSDTSVQAALQNISASTQPKRKIRGRASGRSVESIRKEAAQGDADAQYDLAMMYANGDGVPQDYGQAEEWYHKAAEQGDDEALASLAVIPAATPPDDASSSASESAVPKILVTVLMEPTSALPYTPVGRFSEGLAPVVTKGVHAENRKYGYIDKTGKIVIPLEYDSVSAFSEGLAVVGKGPEKSRKYSFIDKTGKTIIPPLEYDQVWSFSEERAIVAKDYTDNSGRPKYYGFIDKSGKTVIPVEYTAVGRFSDGLAFVIKEDFYDTYDPHDLNSKIKYGYIDKTGNVAIPLDLVMPPFLPGIPWYDGTTGWEFSEGLVMFAERQARGGFDNGYIDKTGKIVIPPEYGLAMRFSEGLAAVIKDRKIGYIDKVGNVVVPFEYENSACWEYGIIYVSFFEGLAAVSKDGKMGYIDKAGNVAVPFEYDVSEEDEGGWIFVDDSADLGMRFSEGLAAVRKNGKMGYIDKAGNVVVPFEYDYASPFSEGLAWVLKGFPGNDDTGWGLLQIQNDSNSTNKFSIATKEDIIQTSIPNNAIRVRNRAELENALREGTRTTSVYVALMNDISVGSDPWVPIHDFQGTVDGLGHIIKDLNIDCRPDWSRVGYVYRNPNAGLLGSTSAAVTIKNLGIEIEKATSIDSEKVATSYGGLGDAVAGTMDFLNTLASNPFKKSDTYYSRAGGLIGLVNSNSKVTIDNCFVSGGAITADVDYNIAGKIDSYSYAGGLIGQAYGSVIISNCYVTGSNIYAHASGKKPWLIIPPKSQSFAGGFVGHGGNNIYISNSYTTNTVTAKGQNPSSGGLVGGGAASITNGFYIENRIINKKNKQGTAISFTDSSFISLFRALSGWYVGSLEFNNGWPDLSVFWRDSVIFVETADELQGIGGPRSAGRTYILRNNIPLRARWAPLSDFRGTLDGGGHTISDLSVSLSSNYSYAGLFGDIQTGNVTIKDLHVKSANVSTHCKSSDSTVVASGGGLIGTCAGGNITIENCTFDGRIIVKSDANVSLAAIISSLPIPSRSFTTWKIVFEELGQITAGTVASNLADTIANYKDRGNAYAGGLIGFVGNRATVRINNSSTYGSVYTWAARVVSSVIIPRDKSVSFSGGLIGYIGSNNVFIENSTPHNKNNLTADGSPQDPFDNHHYTGAISGCNSLK